MQEGRFGEWDIAISVFNGELTIQFKRPDGELVDVWGPSYEPTGKRGTIRLIKTRGQQNTRSRNEDGEVVWFGDE
jgi:hypothetical protein